MKKIAFLAVLLMGLCFGLVVGQEPDPDCLTVVGRAAWEIGTNASLPCNAGSYAKWTRSRAITTASDEDHQWFRFPPTGKGHVVRMGTAAAYSTSTCNLTGPVTANPHTFIELRYGVEKEYHGRCSGSGDACSNSIAAFPKCPIPQTCDPIFIANPAFGTDGFGKDDNPLACNDNRDANGGDFGSEIEVCLPENKLLGTGNVDYCLGTRGSSSTLPPPAATPTPFSYQVQVRNLGFCPIEVEPNDLFSNANPIGLGDTVNGIFDFAGHWPFQDNDLFVFNVTSDTTVTIETMGYDSLKVDTGLELLVGPDDAGNFFLIVSDEDSGPGYLSKITGILPPANALLGNVVANANYYINVTSFSLHPNFPYTLKVS